MLRRFVSRDLVVRAGLMLAAGAAVGLACGPKVYQPDGFPRPVLQPGALAPQAEAEVSAAPSGTEAGVWIPRVPPRPLRVIHRSPRTTGATSDPLVITFNQPMLKLGVASDHAAAALAAKLQIQPPAAVESARWVSGDTLKVVLRKIHRATHYHITLPKGAAKSIAGQVLGEDVSWEFETPRPRLLWAEVVPANPKAKRPVSNRLLAGDHIRLTFSQAIKATSAAPIKLRVDGKPLSYRALPADPKHPRRLALLPTGVMPVGSTVTVHVPAGTESVDGPLGTREVYKRAFLRRRRFDVGVTCREDPEVKVPAGGAPVCYPMAGEAISVRFAEPVRRSQLLRYVRFFPYIPALVKQLSGGGGGDCGPTDPCARSWSITGPLVPGRVYRVTVAAGIQDVFGERNAKAQTFPLKVRSYPSGIFMAREGFGWREPWHPYRVKTMNVKQLDVQIYPLRGAKLVRFWECEKDPKRFGLKPEAQWWECLRGQPNQRRTLRVVGPAERLATQVLPLARGASAVVVSSPEVIDTEKKRLIWRRRVGLTDLGVQARLTAFGVSAWITGLQSGQGRAGVAVTLLDPKGQALWQGKSDASGFVEAPRAALGAVLDGRSPPRLYLVADHGTDQAVVRLGEEDRYGGLSSYSSWDGRRKVYVGYVSTERGIYRPGEAVYVHGAVRRYVEWRGKGAQGLQLQVSLRTSDGQVVARQKVRLGSHGVFRAKLQLPRILRLGYYQARLELPKGHRAATHSFRVAEYRPPRFTAYVRFAARRVGPDVPLRFSAEGTYLFGGKMGGAHVEWEATQYGRSQWWRQHPGFRAGRLTSSKSRLLVRRKGQLDKDGKRQETVPRTPFPWPSYVRVNVEVRSQAFRVANAYDYAYVAPALVYPAIRDISSRGKVVERDLRLFDLTGAPQSGKVEVTLYARGKKYWPRVPNLDAVLWKTTVQVGPRGHRLKIPWPAEAKDYAYLRLAARDAKGRLSMTDQWLYKPYKPARTAYRRPVETKAPLEVTLDKESYRPGDVAKVTVIRRGPGRAGVLFAQRERIFRRWPLRFGAGGRAVVQFKFGPQHVGGISFRAVLVRAGQSLRKTKDEGMPRAWLTAQASADVSDPAHELGVEIKTDRKRYHPRDKVTVDVVVTDGNKKARQAKLVIMAVDEAVLRLTRYHLRDPRRELLHVPDNGILARDLRDYLLPLDIPVEHIDYKARSFGGGGVGFGGGGGAGVGMRGASAPRVFMGSKKQTKKKQKNKTSVRKKFLTAAWHATVTTDDKGRARTSFELPDNLTRFRLMAFAVDDARSAGTGWNYLEVESPLVALPALPRLLRRGDRADGGVIIYNNSKTPGEATVTAEIEGAAALVGAPTRKLRVPPGQSRTARFGMVAKEAGAAKVRFTVTMGKLRDAVEQTLEVKLPTVDEAVAVSGETKTGVAQGIAQLSGISAKRGGLEVQLASTALTGVGDGLEQLIHYPYGCMEQTSSRLLAVLGAKVMADRFAIKLPRKPEEMIAAGVRRVLTMETSAGGFSYWPKSSYWDWATAYGLIVLHRAQQSGVQVPTRTIDRAWRRLRRSVPSVARLSRPEANPSHAAFVLYALSRHRPGKLPRPVLDAILKRRWALSLYGKAMFLATLASLPKGKAKGLEKAVDELVDEVAGGLHVEGNYAYATERLGSRYAIYFSSPVRTSGMVLVSLLAARPNHPMIPRLARWFVAGRKRARYRNTQEAAWALMALWDFARIVEKAVPDFEAGVWLGRKRVITAHFRGRQGKPQVHRVPMSELVAALKKAAQRLVIAKRGTGTLYYTARLRYTRTTMPKRPMEHGFRVEREVVVLDSSGNKALARPARLGDMVKVILKITSPDPVRRYVVVDDPLPAGLEPVDTSLATEKRRRRSAKDDYFDHRELRDDRVLFFRDEMRRGKLQFSYLARVSTPGTFVVPPTKAEEMYSPEVFGRTAGRTVTLGK